MEARRLFAAALLLISASTTLAGISQPLPPCSIWCQSTVVVTPPVQSVDLHTAVRAVSPTLEEAFRRAQKDNAIRNNIATALRVAGAVGNQASDLLPPGKTRAYATPVKLVAEGLSSIGAKLEASYRQNVAFAVLRASNAQLAQQVIHGGAVDPDALANWASNTAGTMYDENQLKKLDPETRAALEWSNHKLTAAALATAIKEASENQLILKALRYEAVPAIGKRLSALTHGLDGVHSSLNSIREDVDAGNKEAKATQQIISQMARDALPAREQLVLIEHQALAVSPQDIADLQRQARIDDVHTAGKAISTSMRSIQSGLAALGENGAAQTVGDAATLVDAGTQLAAAVIAGGPFGVAMAGFSMIGAIHGLGGGGPDPNAVLMEEIQKLATMIKQYHAEEMAALHDIASSIDLLRTDVDDRFDKITAQIDSIESGVQEMLREKDCSALMQGWRSDTLFQRFDSADPDVLAHWFNGNQHVLQLQACLDELATTMAQRDDQPVSSAFLYFPRSGALAEEGQSPISRDKFYRGWTYPMGRYTKSILGETWLGTMTSPHPTAADVLSIGTRVPDVTLKTIEGHPVKFPSFDPLYPWQFNVPTIVRTVDLSMKVAPLYELTTSVEPLRFLTKDELKKRSKVDFESRKYGRDILDRANSLARVALAQEQLLSGIAVARQAARVLEHRVLPLYARERSGEPNRPLSKMLAIVGSGAEMDQHCVHDNPVYDTLCLMQTNPWFAANVMAVITANAAKRKHLTQEWYVSARLDPDSRVLSALLGDSAHLHDTRPDLPARYRNAVKPLWALELPRVEIDFDHRVDPIETAIQAGDDIVAPDCWSEPKTVVKDKNPHPVVASPIASTLAQRLSDARWARCYALPDTIDGTEAMVGRQIVRSPPPLQNEALSDTPDAESVDTREDALQRITAELYRVEDAQWAQRRPDSDVGEIPARILAAYRVK